MSIKEKLNTLLIYAESEAIISQKGVLTYNELFNLINHYSIWLEEMNVLSGSAIMLNADYNSASIALLLALLKNNCIVSLNSTDVPTQNETLQAIVKPAYYISVDKNEHVNLLELSFFQDNSLISNLKKKNRKQE